MAIIISIIGVTITLLEVGFIIFKYSKESKRKRRSETIEKYNKIFNDTYSLRDKFFDIQGKIYLILKILEKTRIFIKK